MREPGPPFRRLGIGCLAVVALSGILRNLPDYSHAVGVFWSLVTAAVAFVVLITAFSIVRGSDG